MNKDRTQADKGDYNHCNKMIKAQGGNGKPRLISRLVCLKTKTDHSEQRINWKRFRLNCAGKARKAIGGEYCQQWK